VAHVRAATGAPAVAAVAEGVGAMTLLGSILIGTGGISGAAALGASLHPVVPHPRRLGRGLDGDLSLQQDRFSDRLLKLQPTQKEERCASAACRRAAYVYGLLYEHDQLNRATHEALHEFVSLPSPTAMAHLRRIARERRLVAHDGADAYLAQRDRLSLPLAFVHGDESEAFKLEGTQMTVASLRELVGPDSVSLDAVPSYGHLDLVIGKDAVDHVYPTVLGFLDRIELRQPELQEA